MARGALSLLVYAVFLANLPMAAADPATRPPGADPGAAWSPADAAESALYLVTSETALRFDAEPRLLCDRAAGPALVRLAHGDLVVLFDRATEDGRTVLAAARSADEGKTWSRAYRLELRGDEKPANPRHPTTVATRQGVRMIFAADGEGGRTVLRSARSDDGLRFEIDDADQFALEVPGEAHPLLVTGRDEVRLLVSVVPDEERPLEVWRFVWQGGKVWHRRPRAAGLDNVLVGSAIAKGSRCGVWAGSPEGLEFLYTGDGGEWRAAGEDKVELPDAEDAAVIRLRKGGWLMVYARPAGSADARGALVKAASFDEADSSAWPEVAGADDEGDFAGADDRQISWTDAAGETAGRDGAEPADDRAEADERVSDFEELAAAAGARVAADVAGVAFAPPLDFDDPFDYIGWLMNRSAGVRADAAEAYRAIIPSSDDPTASGTWPESFNDMLNGDDHTGPPIPWDAATHPEWEASYQATQGLREMFKLASQLPGYRTIFERANEPGEPDLAFNLRVPSVFGHRTLVKATLASAWRRENGVVPPQQMIEALETAGLAAHHLDQGTTLAERLVGIGESLLMRRHARQALAQGVFADEESLLAAKAALERSDPPSPDMAEMLAFEHAAALDLFRHLYNARTPEGEPKLNPQVAAELLNETAESPEAYALFELSPDELHRVVANTDEFFRELAGLMRVGYPEVRAAEIDAKCEAAAFEHASTKMVIAPFSRPYLMQHRAEAERRATQLAFSMHIFAARNGRWPASLDELPDAADVRTDPFTGRDFIYRLEADGPRLYSASENGLDDGGIHSSRWDDEVTNEAGSDDFVFWPPQE